MEELYIEGVAIHGGPESCVVVREGGGEALTGVRAGRAIEPRNKANRDADDVVTIGRQHRWQRYREVPADPARSKNHGMCVKLHAREPGGPALARQVDYLAGRSGNAAAVSLR